MLNKHLLDIDKLKVFQNKDMMIDCLDSIENPMQPKENVRKHYLLLYQLQDNLYHCKVNRFVSMINGTNQN
jgi:hypothetical protein